MRYFCIASREISSPIVVALMAMGRRFSGAIGKSLSYVEKPKYFVDNGHRIKAHRLEIRPA